MVLGPVSDLGPSARENPRLAARGRSLVVKFHSDTIGSLFFRARRVIELQSEIRVNYSKKPRIKINGHSDINTAIRRKKVIIESRKDISYL